jgi:EAL and modified HD-GYP domain-containing signal transduction protein
MDIIIARQPIFDKNLKVVAYELLYRSNIKDEQYTGVDGDFSTASIIMGSFLHGGIENITDNKLAFINFTDSLLKNDVIKLLPAKQLVIEILETVKPDEDIFAACRELNKLGYTLALDDYVFNELTKEFINYAKIIKMDFNLSSDDQLQSIVNEYRTKGIKFLAEKIETKDQFIKAQKYGYTYFHGYYFCRPSLVANKVLLPLQMNALNLLRLLLDENCEINDIAKIINYDPGMKYKLLRLANSVLYGGRQKIRKSNIAIAKIGLEQLRTWVLFVVMHGMYMDKPNELIKQSMIRARVAERICTLKNLSEDTSVFSMLGLFSLLDAIMDISFEVILASLNIADDIKAALINPNESNDVICIVLRLIRAYDDVNWKEAEEMGTLINLSLEEYVDIYVDSIKWCDGVFKSYNIRN